MCLGSTNSVTWTHIPTLDNAQCIGMDTSLHMRVWPLRAGAGMLGQYGFVCSDP